MINKFLYENKAVGDDIDKYVGMVAMFVIPVDEIENLRARFALNYKVSERYKSQCEMTFVSRYPMKYLADCILVPNLVEKIEG